MAASLSDVVPLHIAEARIPAGPLAGARQLVVAFAITTAKGVVLFETGPGRPSFPTVSSEYGARSLDYYNMMVRPLEDELALHGITLDDVRAIVNSHLHWDHCGGNPLFPGVPIYVQSAEYAAAQTGGRDYTVPDWVDFPGAEFVVIDGDTRIADGLRVIATPGHSPGHQSLVLDTRDGPVAFAGQAIGGRADYDQLLSTGAIEPTGVDAKGKHARAPEVVTSAQRLVDTGARRVHFSHDHDIWERDGSHGVS